MAAGYLAGAGMDTKSSFKHDSAEQFTVSDARRGGFVKRCLIVASACIAFLAPTCSLATVILEADPIQATEGSFFDGSVAVLVSLDDVSAASNYEPTINWGDGTTDFGSVTSLPSPTVGFSVNGQHVYSEAGTYSLTITVFDAFDGSTSTPVSTSATVADAPLSASGVNFDSTLGTLFSGVVATFVDDNQFALARDFTGFIDWGDGTPTTLSTIAQNGVQGFNVLGQHTYTSPGFMTVTVQINDVGGSTASAISHTQPSDRIFADNFDGTPTSR